MVEMKKLIGRSWQVVVILHRGIAAPSLNVKSPIRINFCGTNFCDWQKMKDFAGLIFAVDKKWKFSSSEMKIIFVETD